MGNMFRCTLSSGGALILTVTCDSAFAGQTITCTDGTTTLTQICPSTSPYTVEFRIPNGGTWTISSGTDSTSVVIPDAIELHFIPNGSTITPTDDVQIWLHCAGIWDKDYTTVSQVLSDSSTLQALIASNNAADYMARSTTWASGVTADASAMTYIGLNNYCANKLLANSTWLNAICNSTYFENVLTIKIPTMTSDTAPSGIASSQSNWGGTTRSYAYNAFDQKSNTMWQSAANSGNQWLQYQFANAMIPRKCVLNPSSSATRALIFNILASTDGSSWDTLLDNETCQAGESETSYVLNNNDGKAYTYFRLQATQFNMVASGANRTMIRLLQLYGRA